MSNFPVEHLAVQIVYNFHARTLHDLIMIGAWGPQVLCSAQTFVQVQCWQLQKYVCSKFVAACSLAGMLIAQEFEGPCHVQ